MKTSKPELFKNKTKKPFVTFIRTVNGSLSDCCTKILAFINAYYVVYANYLFNHSNQINVVANGSPFNGDKITFDTFVYDFLPGVRFEPGMAG